MQIHVGTSGFSYDEWNGSFYPEALPADERLRFYASELGSVEVNATFHRMPKPSVLEAWSAATPPEFRFALKASRRITHIGKLANVADSVKFLVDTFSTLGEKLGVVLFQIPPLLKRDDARLEAFLELLPAGYPAAFEVRHASWFDDAVFDALRAKNVALVLGDPDEGGPVAPWVATSDRGYLRLRAETYSEEELAERLERIRSLPWREVFVFFKHETLAPVLARGFQRMAQGQSPSEVTGDTRGPGVARAPAPAPRAPKKRASGR